MGFRVPVGVMGLEKLAVAEIEVVWGAGLGMGVAVCTWSTLQGPACCTACNRFLLHVLLI
jgi:hypothetical protein